VAERLSADAVAIIESLPPDGSAVGNIRLRQQLGLVAERYSGAAIELKALGLVVAGRGRGGSLALSDAGKNLRSQLVSEEPRPTLDEPATSPPSPFPESSRQAPSRRATGKQNGGNGGPLGFEDALWKAADKLRGSMDSSEYKHVVLGLVFLKYIDDAFSERRRQLMDDLDGEGITGEQGDELLESRDEYTAEGIFWVPPEARWGHLQASAKQPEIGKLIDNAMDLVELDNPSLRGVLPKNFSRPALDVRRLGELVDLISGIGLGSTEHREKDILGRVYEYFLGRFASAEGKGGGEFYTPRSVVKLLVEMIEPYRGRVYDPCCGSGGMFVQSERFVEAHGGRRNDIAVYGQESNDTTWRMAKMNLAIRGIEADLGPRWADSFHEDLHPDLKADYILANPPFNISDWGGERLRDDPRWSYGVPPAGNANYAWLEHMASHLSPRGVAGIVLANGSLSTQTSGEGTIRGAMVERDLVECIVAMPGQLFYSTQIPVSLWLLNRDKANGHTRSGTPTWRDRRGEMLFIDCRKLGALVDRTHRELTDDDMGRVADTYHAWRGEPGAGTYTDVPGFCSSVSMETIRQHGCVLTPGRYVGSEAAEADDEPIGEKVTRLTRELYEAFEESDRLQERARAALGRISTDE
jgi:type I restriction enzyme M protein